jgi:hypothetical protein
MKSKWMIYSALFLAGVILAGRVRSIPILDKLPTI